MLLKATVCGIFSFIPTPYSERNRYLGKAKCSQVTYSNEVIVSFKTDTYGVPTPGHGLGNVWCSKVPLRDKHKLSGDWIMGKRKSPKSGLHSRESQHIVIHLQLIKLSVFPIIQLQLLFNRHTHPQPLLPCTGLLRRQNKQIITYEHRNTLY